MKKQEIVALTEELASALCAEMGYELWDVEYVKEGQNMYLKVFADKEGGFSINDCVDLSRALEVKLEEKDPIETAYVLEVSSPGLDRPLKKNKDFEKSIGKLVEVKLYQADKKNAETAERGLEKEFVAQLNGYNEETCDVELELEDGREVVVNKKEMASIRLAVIF